jgi:EAL domain-containing protein (putative c-di-GMP-specific phosphodiesterase class I)/CheY-like chemotaxis protein
VIGNLVNNAIKFTDDGGVLIAIDRDPTDGDRVRISVHDTGPGIPADKLPSLFEAFTQADQSTTRTHGGTGLGLAICDRLVRSMGGEWALSSVVGEGSTFAFSAAFAEAAASSEVRQIRPGWAVSVKDLSGQTRRSILLYLDAWGLIATDEATGPSIVGPAHGAPDFGVVICSNEHEAEALLRVSPDACVMTKPLRQVDLKDVIAQMQEGVRPRLSCQPVRLPPGTTFPGVRVLVVDDSEVNREVAVEALSRLGVDTSTASDGLQAVECLRAQGFDMVLMDGSMPVLDGFEATLKIRSEEAETGRTRAVIVGLTAHVVGSGADAWKTSGMDGVIYKPFTLEDLVRELARFCGDKAVAGSVVSLPVASASRADEVRTDLFDTAMRAELLGMARNGRADFVERVHALYATNAPLQLAEIVQGAASEDADRLARAAHALKSMSLSLGASAVARETSRIETAARSGEPVASIGIESIQSLVALTLAAMTQDEPVVPLSAQEELAAAMDRGDLELVYQPLVDRTGRLSGKVEALVRWTHPQQGQLSPDDFIPRLEAEGCISRLTDFVMTRAMQDLEGRPDIQVAVNTSASEFQLPGFAARVAAAATALGFPPERLEVEVTETAMLNVEAARRTIDELRAHGFGVALDDFGSGYTSLHALRTLKFTTLKIDRSFVERCVSDTASAAIIHAVIGVGRALGMKIVCEGVETADQANFLRIAGTHYMQGYHFHRAMRLQALLGVTEEAA